MGGAVIDTINNCGWLAGEQIIFSSADEVTDFICKYGPSLVYSTYSAGKDYPAITMEYKCSYSSSRYNFDPEASTNYYYITF